MYGFYIGKGKEKNIKLIENEELLISNDGLWVMGYGV